MTNTTRTFTTTDRTCRCGCQTPLVGKKARFRPGHDQRLVGILVRAQTAGDELVWNGKPTTPRDYAQAVYSPSGFAKVTAALDADRKPKGKSGQAPVKVKIGRWTYDARVTQMSDKGKVTQVRYENKSGNTVTTDQFAIVAD